MTGCTITGNTAPFLGSIGGGVWNQRGATLTMIDCVVTDNHADNTAAAGGGIGNERGNLTLTGCTVSGNTALRLGGGGILNFNGSLTLNNGTSVTQNSADFGGGIDNVGGTLTLNPSSLVCDNSAPQCTGFSPPSGFCGACP